MRFRPCIDIHNGKVKQIVGGSLQDKGDQAKENFISDKDAAWYAGLYRKYGLTGGHVILLNAKESPWYRQTRAQALEALGAYPGGLQIGGGITPETAPAYLEAGADKVIVTSYVFQDGQVAEDRLKQMVRQVTRDRLVLDISCRRQADRYYIVTDRWQKFTKVELTVDSLDYFGEYACELLVHAVDVEGRAEGIETAVAELLGGWGRLPVTYAGGIHSYEDIQCLHALGRGKVDFTIGSALDIFGGELEFEKVAAMNIL